MNFTDMAAQAWRCGRGVTVAAAAAAFAATAFAPVANAQQPAAPAQQKAKSNGKAAPKAAPKAEQPAQQTPAAQPPQQQVQLIYAPWTKFCLKGQDANAKQVCFTGKDGRIESGQPVAMAD